MRERAEEVLRRQEQHDHRGDRIRQRHADASGDQKDEARRQRRADRRNREERAESIDAEYGTSDDRKQMRRWRVVRHLAHRSVERSIVHQMAGLLDVVNEQEVMRQIGPAPRRHERRPRHPQECQDEEDDDAEPCDQVARVRIRGPWLQCRHDPGADDRSADRRPRLKTETSRIDQIRDDRRESEHHRRKHGSGLGGRDAAIGQGRQVPILPSLTGWAIIVAMSRWFAVFVLIASNAAAQQAPTVPRFRAGAEVIAIDVTVIERTGVPVGDLTAADFSVTVEGKPRAIQSAQFLRSDASRAASRRDESSNTDAASGRLLLIVTDDGSLRPGSQAVVEAAGKVLDYLGPGDLVGVAHIPDGGGVPFTTDRRRVTDELKRVRPASGQFRTDTTVYISEALDFDGPRQVQWPAAVRRECGAEADSPVFRLCMVNLEYAARQLLIDESMRTTAAIRGLERLMKSLAPTGQPVTLVLISESMVIARDPAALVGLAEACAEARVSLHVVQPAPPSAEMTARGYPSDQVTDLALRVEGLELMAAQARGAFHRVVSTGASTFDAIGREVSGYYLLGIEPDAEDRRQPRRRVDVKVKRPGLTGASPLDVRARSLQR